MDNEDPGRPVEDQIAYYRARAPEYDATSLKGQALDSGEDQEWLDEQGEALRALGDFAPTGQVLEIAAGTGQWTGHLLRWADSLTAVDAAPEVLAINRSRVGDDSVTRVAADIFAWEPDAVYDAVFFAFWLSHVPEALFDHFWSRVAKLLKPTGRVFFIDERMPGGWERALFRNEGDESGTVVRRLSDGRQFRIVKVFYEPEDLAHRLIKLGWDIAIESPGRWLYYGSGQLAPN
jgi:demethylmenaquinone methyltransferase/2-methoxy-6-polyprenyl-1,4-benzoquinol methylase